MTVGGSVLKSRSAAADKESAIMVTLAFWNNPMAWVLVLGVVLLLFGGQKIPEMMRGLGSGMREFKKGMNEEDEELRVDQEKRRRVEEEVRARVEEEMRNKKNKDGQ
jgi:sec-independent protein translocase protein TatA